MTETGSAGGTCILVHGGAGRAPSRADREPILNGMARAAEAARGLLVEGATAMDAVIAAVTVLEDDPLFNAGYGAVLTDEGAVELDAAVMCGGRRTAGAVGALQGFGNPAAIARAVLEEGEHVFLVGAGAEAFARERGFPPVSPEALIAPGQRARWQRARGTVGAVARDGQGTVAAATSTGGTFGKRAGRVGDTPVIGAGTYAIPQAAVSCTGHGERILRATLARDTASMIERGWHVAGAADAAVTRLGEFGGGGGLIVLGSDGEVAFACDSPSMPVAYCRDRNTVTVRDIGSEAG